MPPYRMNDPRNEGLHEARFPWRNTDPLRRRPISQVATLLQFGDIHI